MPLTGGLLSLSRRPSIKGQLSIEMPAFSDTARTDMTTWLDQTSRNQCHSKGLRMDSPTAQCFSCSALILATKHKENQCIAAIALFQPSTLLVLFHCYTSTMAVTQQQLCLRVRLTSLPWSQGNCCSKEQTVRAGTIFGNCIL